MTYTLVTHHTGNPGWVAQIYKRHLPRWTSASQLSLPGKLPEQYLQGSVTHPSLSCRHSHFKASLQWAPKFQLIKYKLLMLVFLPACSHLFYHYPFWIKTYPDSGICTHRQVNASNGPSISPIKCSFGPRLDGSSLLMSNVTSCCPSTTFSLKLLALGLELIISFWKVHIIENWNKRRSKIRVSHPPPPPLPKGITEQLDSSQKASFTGCS